MNKYFHFLRYLILKLMLSINYYKYKSIDFFFYLESYPSAIHYLLLCESIFVFSNNLYFEKIFKLTF